MKRLNSKGFTLVELMIASLVFSVVLILISTAMIQIGRLYYKGIITSKTQEAARTVIDDISRTFQFQGGNFAPVSGSNPGYCIGGRRYSYVVNRQLITNTQHALVVDNPVGNCVAAGSQNINTAAVSGEELIGERMRLQKISINPIGSSGLYTINVRIAYGDDDLLVDSDGAGPGLPSCVSSGKGVGTQFCAVSELTTTVQKRLN